MTILLREQLDDAQVLRKYGEGLKLQDLLNTMQPERYPTYLASLELLDLIAKVSNLQALVTAYRTKLHCGYPLDPAGLAAGEHLLAQARKALEERQ